MHPILALGIVAALNTAVIYVVADDVLTLDARLTGTQAAWLGLAVTVVPALVYATIA